MIFKQVRTAAPNSVVLVMDQSVGEVPQSMNGDVVSISPTCIAVGTVSASDEQVLLELTDKSPEPQVNLKRILITRISTPNREVSVCSVYDEKLLSIDVPSDFSQIEIWTSHEFEPDRIVVVVCNLAESSESRVR